MSDTTTFTTTASSTKQYHFDKKHLAEAGFEPGEVRATGDWLTQDGDEVHLAGEVELEMLGKKYFHVTHPEDEDETLKLVPDDESSAMGLMWVEYEAKAARIQDSLPADEPSFEMETPEPEPESTEDEEPEAAFVRVESEDDAEAEAEAPDDDESAEDEAEPTCAGMGGDCSRTVSTEGEFCYQHEPEPEAEAAD